MDSDDRQPAERGLSWWALLLGLAFGIAAALVYTWEIDPVIERNTAPWQLSEADREDYVIAVALSYTANQDLALAFDRLRALRPSQDVWSLVADIACNRIKTGQVVTNNDIRVIRALEGPLAAVRGEPPEDTEYAGPAGHLRDVWVATRASMRTVLERNSLADIVEGHLPEGPAQMLDQPGAWERR